MTTERGPVIRELKATRTFETGATRSSSEGKFGYEGFLSPLVLRRFGAYMHKHRALPDGSLREPDNWQRGIPLSSYMDSLWRHFMDLWLHHRQFEALAVEQDIEDVLCALLFNIQGYLHVLLTAEYEANNP